MKEKQEVTGGPKVDNLSKQIVELMDERKGEQAYDRLYKKGKDKLRTNTEKTMMQNAKSIRELESPGMTLTREVSYQNFTNGEHRRGKPTSDALYALAVEKKNNL